MWTMTIDGFFSAVQHRDKPKHVMVRARSRADLVRLLARLQPKTGVEIISTPDGDYPFRVVITKIEWSTYCARAAQAVEDTNFKNGVARRLGWHRAHVYHDVWTALLGIENEDDSGVDPATRSNPYADTRQYLAKSRAVVR